VWFAYASCGENAICDINCRLSEPETGAACRYAGWRIQMYLREPVGVRRAGAVDYRVGDAAQGVTNRRQAVLTGGGGIRKMHDMWVEHQSGEGPLGRHMQQRNGARNRVGCRRQSMGPSTEEVLRVLGAPEKVAGPEIRDREQRKFEFGGDSGRRAPAKR